MHPDLMLKSLFITALWAGGFFLGSLGLTSTFNSTLHHCISWTPIASRPKPHPTRPHPGFTGSVTNGRTLTTAVDGTTPGSSPSLATTASIAAAASASASSFSSQVASVYPAIQSWIDDPDPPKASVVVDAIKKTRPRAHDIIDSLGGRTSSGPPCNKKHGKRIKSPGDILGDLIDPLSCISDTIGKISSTVEKSIPKKKVDTKVDIKDVTSQFKGLKSVLKSLGKNDKKDDDKDNESKTTDRYTKTNKKATTHGNHVTTAQYTEKTHTVSITTSTSREASSTTSESSSASSAAPKLCSPDCETCGSNKISLDETLHRELSYYYPGANISDVIAKRVLPDAPDNRDKFLRWLKRYISTGQRATQVPHLIQQALPSSEKVVLGNSVLSIGQAGLYGCTSVIVVSRYAIYMSHHWEKPAFRIIKDRRMVLEEANFQTGVLDYLETTLPQPEFVNSEKYPDPHTKAFIVSPRARTPTLKPKFGNELDRISEKLMEKLGLSEEPRIHLYNSIHSPDRRDPGDYDPEVEYIMLDGKLVVIYDPNNNDATNECEKKPGVAIWNGDDEGHKRDPFFSTDWNKPPQRTGVPEKRDTRGACSKAPSSSQKLTTKKGESGSKTASSHAKPTTKKGGANSKTKTSHPKTTGKGGTKSKTKSSDSKPTKTGPKTKTKPPSPKQTTKKGGNDSKTKTTDPKTTTKKKADPKPSNSKPTKKGDEKPSYPSPTAYNCKGSSQCGMRVGLHAQCGTAMKRLKKDTVYGYFLPFSP